MTDAIAHVATPPVSPGSLSTSVGEYSDWASVSLLSFLDPQLNGQHPYVRVVAAEADTTAIDTLSSYLPADATVLRDGKSKTNAAILANTDRELIFLIATKSSVRAMVSGSDLAAVESVVKGIKSRFPEPPTPDDSTVPIHVWHQGGNGGGVAQRRRLEVPRWEEIAKNYSNDVRRQLTELMAMSKPETTGRLILWHGIPGTGKTTAIRALMAAWAPWCDSQFVIDPEVAFAEPSYLTDLMTRSFSESRRVPWIDDDDFDSDDDDDDSRWKLLIAEDSDEFLRADARQTAGAALGRLLNLSDGILGQGSNTLILLTTNEDMRELHPALVRPGRALAKTEFTTLSVDESNDWLNGTATVSTPKTIAELYELRGETKRIGDQKSIRPQIGFGV